MNVESTTAAATARLKEQEKRFDYFGALKTLDELLAAEPDKIEWRLKRALTLNKVGRVEDAIAALEKLRAEGVRDTNLTIHLGHAYKSAGDSGKAASFYQSLVDSGDKAKASVGYWSLADMKDYRFSAAELAALRKRTAELTEEDGHRFLTLFALGRAHEQHGQYREAFAAMKQANDLVSRIRPFDAAGFRKFVSSQMAISEPPAPASQAPAMTPIFIVGMPRSGTTLIEQVLASHSQVEATDELPFIERMALFLEMRGGCARALQSMSDAQKIEGADVYLRDVQPFLRSAPRAFTDKLPGNFQHVGLIRTLLPNAKVINVMRDPVDNAMSVFKQYFGMGNDHSFSLDAIVFYWQGYLSLMAHWDKLYPGDILHVGYEQLVEQPEHWIRRVLDYCELEFEPQCLRFYESDRAVLTPSASQVRQPITNRSVGSGMKYAEDLKDYLPKFRQISDVMHDLFLNRTV
jgi:tetratricopeptide (TPR) repeat protein